MMLQSLNHIPADLSKHNEQFSDILVELEQYVSDIHTVDNRLVVFNDRAYRAAIRIFMFALADKIQLKYKDKPNQWRVQLATKVNKGTASLIKEVLDEDMYDYFLKALK